MKSFLEEYGFAILAAIVVILLIAMCTPVGNLIRNQVMSVVESFAGRTESKLAAIDEADIKVLDEEDPDHTCKVTILAIPSSTNKYSVRFRVDGGSWTVWDTNKDLGKGGVASQAGTTKQKVEYEIMDQGTKNVVYTGQCNLK